MEFSGCLPPPQGNKALLVKKSFFPPSSSFKKATSPWGPGMALGGVPLKSHEMNRISGQLPLSRTRVRVVVIEGASGPYPSCWVVGLV